MSEQSFDPAAEFLLDLPWHNLFEPKSAAPGSDYWWVCKGCRAEVPLPKREDHYKKHRGIRKRSETMRQAKIKRERIKRLEKARAAKA